MDARSSDVALPSTPPRPAGAPSPSQPPSPTRNEKQAQVRALLASLNEQYFVMFKTHLQHAFSALKLQNEDRNIISQYRIKSCRVNIGDDFEFIVSGLSALGPDRLPDWLARRIFITPSQKRPDIIPADNPSQKRRDIIPADDLFQVYSAWCSSHEEFDFYSALTELLILGLRAVSDRSIGEGKTFFDDTLISEVDDHL